MDPTQNHVSSRLAVLKTAYHEAVSQYFRNIDYNSWNWYCALLLVWHGLFAWWPYGPCRLLLYVLAKIGRRNQIGILILNFRNIDYNSWKLTLCDAACLAWPVCVVTIWPMRADALLMESGYFEQTFAIIMIIYSKGSFKNYFDKKGYRYRFQGRFCTRLG